MGGDGWDPLKESLCEYVQRIRVEEQMDDYDDQRERHLEQKRALGLYWARAPSTVHRPCSASNLVQLSLWPVTVHDEAPAA